MSIGDGSPDPSECLLPATGPPGELLGVPDDRKDRHEQLVDDDEEEEPDQVVSHLAPERLEDAAPLVVEEDGVHGQRQGDDGEGHRTHDPEETKAGEHDAGDLQEDVRRVEQGDGQVDGREHPGQACWRHGGTVRSPSIIPRAQRERCRANPVIFSGAPVNATARGSKYRRAPFRSISHVRTMSSPMASGQRPASLTACLIRSSQPDHGSPGRTSSVQA